MSTNQDSPLNDSHLRDITNALDAIKRAQVQIDLAKRAGLDMTSQENTLKEKQGQLIQLKQTYFPNQ